MKGQNINKNGASCPPWVEELKSQGKSLYCTSNEHVWMRFHKWAFMRFPPHDIQPVEKEEKDEMFFKAKAAVISHHHQPIADEIANSILYICYDKEYDISKLSSNNRSKVRRGLKRLEVRRTTATEISQKGYNCYHDTCTRNGIAPISQADFETKWNREDTLTSRELWAAFAGDEMAASGIVWICGKWAELFSTQSSNDYLKDYSNHALFYTILHNLMHRDEIESVSYGLSSVQPNSKKNSLHHFKLSVNFEAIPVIRKIEVNPLLRLAVNSASLSGVQLLQNIFPRSGKISAAAGAIDLIVNGVKEENGFEEEQIRPIKPDDAQRVAIIHRNVFPDYSSTRLGKKFCTELYKRYAESRDAFGFVFFNNNDCVGFVVGGTMDVHARINRELRLKALTSMSVRPKFLLKTLRETLTSKTVDNISNGREHHDGISQSIKKANKNQIAKLILIGVCEKARGTGAASKLMEAFCREAAERGFTQAMLNVRRDNARARAAYEKVGWSLEERTGDGVEYYINLDKFV